MNKARRTIVGIAGTMTVFQAMPSQWTQPVVKSVVLPAHAQTSCQEVTTVGGPLIGNPSGATSCQAACEAEADTQDALLCAVNETTTPTGVECACDLDST